MIAAYFPAGACFCGFYPIFRLHEPFQLLKPTYFNHAHNDFLEIVLDGGLPALLLMLVAIGWYGMASMRAWRGSGRHSVLPKLGSAILFLVFVASAFDYPARTPRSEEHTSELQSLMRISYAVFCLKKKKHNNNYYN